MLGAVWGIQASAQAAQPYIDSIREGLKAESTEGQSYIEKEKARLAKEGETTAQPSYIEGLKAADPEKFTPVPTPSYIEQERAKLKPEAQGGAIAAVKEGHSDLHAKITGEIHHAAGLQIGVGVKREITLTSDASRSFSNWYSNPSGFPDIRFFYEWQPFHSEWFGNIGLMIYSGISYFDGIGTFPPDLSGFPSESRTRLSFFEVPLMAGATYRFNLLRILRPYVTLGAGLIGYLENRSDSKAGNRGYSKALLMTGGVAISLGWMDPKQTFELYAQHGFQHFFLSLEYSRLVCVGTNQVNFSHQGITAGLTVEY